MCQPALKNVANIYLNRIKELWHFLDIFEQLEAIWMRDEGVPIYSPTPSKLKKSWKENRTFSRSDHCNDPFPNHKLHIQIIIIWCYHYYSKQLFAKKRECLLKNIPKINEKPIFSVFSETLIPQFVKADKYLDMIFRTSFYTSMID